MDQIQNMKRDLYLIYSVLDKAEVELRLSDKLNGMRLRDLFRNEMLSYLMYLSSSDGKIVPVERDFMNELFDINMSIQDYVNYINENDIYSEDFEEKLPYSLYNIISYDALMLSYSQVANFEFKPFAPLMLNFMSDVGKVFISCDGDVDPQEIEDFKNYCLKLMNRSETYFNIFVNKMNIKDDANIGFIKGKKPRL